MIARCLYFLGRWTFFAAAALVAAGAFPFAGHTADALVGTAGPVMLTVAPVVNLSDAQPVSIHADADPGVTIYSVTAHLCLPGQHTGDFFFSFAGSACTNVPVGQSDVEQITVLGGASSADLTFKVGTGTANWMNTRGFPYTITCDASNPCDLVIRVEITNSTVYFRAPLCFGTACPPDLSGLPSPPVAGQGSNSAASGTGSEAAASTGAPGSTGSGPGTPSQSAGTSTVAAGGSAAAPPTTTVAPKAGKDSAVGASSTSRSSSSPEATNLTTAQDAVSVPTGGLPRNVRVFVAALAGALGGARIISVLSRARRRSLGGVR